MTKNYTTKTASLKATKIDARNLDAKKISIDGKNVLDYIDENETIVKDTREAITENDLWVSETTKDENGAVIISHNPIKKSTGIYSAWNRDVTKVEDNKAYIGDELYANIQTDAIVDGCAFFRTGNIESFKSKLTSMTTGYHMFSNSKLKTFEADTPSLTNGDSMFWSTDLESFKGDLSNLTMGFQLFNDTKLTSIEDSDVRSLSTLSNGQGMFAMCSKLTNVDLDLQSLTDGNSMFTACENLEKVNLYTPIMKSASSMFMDCWKLTDCIVDMEHVKNAVYAFAYTSITSFTKSLQSLVIGQFMFQGCDCLEKFNSKLSSLENGEWMFDDCIKLRDFKCDNLNSLKRGYEMFEDTLIPSFTYDLPKLINGDEMFNGCTKLTSFIGALPSLISGNNMFKNCKLDTFSLMTIADSINNLVEAGYAIKNGNKWEYNNNSSYFSGTITISFETSGLSEEQIQENLNYCQEISDKGWTVYASGTTTGSHTINPTAIDDMEEMTPVSIPYYAKPILSDEKNGNYTDNNGNYYNIIGGQYIFGDDVSSYGMFLNEEEAALNMGLTKIEKIKNRKR